MQVITALLFILLIAGIVWPTASSTRKAPDGIIVRKKSLSEEEVKVSQVISLRGGETKSWMSKFFYPIKKLLAFLFPTKSKSKYPSLKKKISKTDSKSKVTKAIVKPKSTTTSSSSGLGRLQREVQSFLTNPPPNLSLEVNPKNIRSWIVTMIGAEGSPYAGETYRLKMEFSKDYPAKPPAVYFLKPVPRHVHVYSNGDICLNLLGKDWRPMITAESLAMSIFSMLASAKLKKLPPDNALHADVSPGQQQDNWMYHDDRC